MKRTSQSPHGLSSPRRASRYLMLAALLAAPVAHGQSNAPVTGSMMQVTPEQRARMEEAVRQAQAEEQARRAAAAQQQAAQQQAAQQQAAQRAAQQQAVQQQALREAQMRAAQQQAPGAAPTQQAAPAASRPTSSVVRQVPGPGAAPAASAQPSSTQRPQVVQSPEQRVTTVVTPQAAAATPPATAQPASAAPATAAAAAPAAQPIAAAPAASGRKSRPNGDVTNAVLRAQAEGRLAGQALPMLGATASPSWKRYIDSFSLPIPDFYETTSQPKQ